MILTCWFLVFWSKFQGQLLGHLKVNNLATFLANILGKCGQVIDLEVFTCFLLKLVFYLIFPCRQKKLFENKKQQNTMK